MRSFIRPHYDYFYRAVLQIPKFSLKKIHSITVYRIFFSVNQYKMKHLKKKEKKETNLTTNNNFLKIFQIPKVITEVAVD